jgi:hypothetical protein
LRCDRLVIGPWRGGNVDVWGLLAAAMKVRCGVLKKGVKQRGELEESGKVSTFL